MHDAYQRLPNTSPLATIHYHFHIAGNALPHGPGHAKGKYEVINKVLITTKPQNKTAENSAQNKERRTGVVSYSPADTWLPPDQQYSRCTRHHLHHISTISVLAHAIKIHEKKIYIDGVSPTKHSYQNTQKKYGMRTRYVRYSSNCSRQVRRNVCATAVSSSRMYGSASHATATIENTMKS